MNCEHEFPITRWSVVLQAQGSDSDLRDRALEVICQTYWLPVYAFARTQGLAPADAEDLTQGVLSYLLDKRAFENVTAEKGRLRSFLRVATKHYLCNSWNKANAKKRGGGAKILSLDCEDAERLCLLELADGESPDRIFDRHWGINLLNRATLRLESLYEGEGKGETFDALRGLIASRDGGLTYKELAGQLGMTEGAVKMAVHRLRKRYRRLLKEEIALTIADESEAAVDEEIHYLFGVFAS